MSLEESNKNNTSISQETLVHFIGNSLLSCLVVSGDFKQ
jgi:hypothetical protein